MNKIFTKLQEMVDSESVRLFVWPYYLALLTWGVYATVVGWPLNVVEPVMGHVVYDAWLWMHIPGTLFVMVGLVLRHGGLPVHEMRTELLFADFLGLYMQRGGHICMGILLSCYEYAIVAGGNFNGQPEYSFFITVPYVLGCVFLAYQVHRKIQHGEKLHRAWEGILPS